MNLNVDPTEPRVTSDAALAWSRPHRAFIRAVVGQVRAGNYELPASLAEWRDLVTCCLGGTGNYSSSEPLHVVPSWGGRYHRRAYVMLWDNAHGPKTAICATIKRSHTIQ